MLQRSQCGGLNTRISVGLQAQPINQELVSKMLGNRVAVSPIVTVEPRRRKFHKPITLTIPLPQAKKGMINQYEQGAPTLRLLCSITGKRKFSLACSLFVSSWFCQPNVTAWFTGDLASSQFCAVLF